MKRAEAGIRDSGFALRWTQGALSVSKDGVRGTRTIVAVAGLVLCLPASVWAQAPTPGVPPAPAPAPSPPAPAPVESEPFTYSPDGRRDPFVSLVARGVETRPSSAGSIPGVGGLTTAELSVRGVLQSRGEYIAMIQGADTRTHIAHVNDRLLDGVIARITPEGVVILQEVNDPLSLVKQREVRKNLRSMEDSR